MNKLSQPLVSVVTPVFNGEKYLKECIESILVQTYQYWEYTIVNNCSTDRTLEIAQHYANKDVRIRIHNNKKFLQAIKNQDYAMRQISAESRYCKVVHADDFLFPECLMEMVQLAEAHPSVGVVGSYRIKGDRVYNRLPYPLTVISGHEICRKYLRGEIDNFGNPTMTLIRSDLVRSREIFYDENVYNPGVNVICDILQESDFSFVHKVLTFTREHENRLTYLNRRLGTHYLGMISITEKYGPIYLNDNEFKKCVKRVWKNYYVFLAGRIFRLRESKFWDYHRNALKKLGHSFSLIELSKAMSLIILDVLMNPKNTMIRAIRKYFQD